MDMRRAEPSVRFGETGLFGGLAIGIDRNLTLQENGRLEVPKTGDVRKVVEFTQTEGNAKQGQGHVYWQNNVHVMAAHKTCVTSTNSNISGFRMQVQIDQSVVYASMAEIM